MERFGRKWPGQVTCSNSPQAAVIVGSERSIWDLNPGLPGHILHIQVRWLVLKSRALYI